MSIYQILALLDRHRIPYHLLRTRPDAILISITLVGMRVEVSAFEDGSVEVSRFKGDEAVEGGSEMLEALIRDADK